MSNNNIPLVYLTGFGPFGCHSENVSETVVRLIDAECRTSLPECRVVTDILPVQYAATRRQVPARVQELRPDLVIHCGVSHLAKHFTLETRAFNTAYTQKDVEDCTPDQHLCVEGCPDVLQSALPLEKAEAELNSRQDLGLKTALSTDPGRFLCCYSYFLSLHHNHNRSVFVHLPTVAVSDAQTTAETLLAFIKVLLRLTEAGKLAAKSC